MTTSMNPARKIPSKISPRGLEKAALFHLERRALTEAQLRRTLEQKVKRAERHHGPCADAGAWIDDVVARCLRSGLVDDTRVATGRAMALRDRGTSKRAVLMKLRQKGVDGALAAKVLGDVDEAAGGNPELEAARAYVRRRKLLGKDRQKSLAALARQGFSFDVAKRALDAESI